jgi:hypothetical protein
MDNSHGKKENTDAGTRRTATRTQFPAVVVVGLTGQVR